MQMTPQQYLRFLLLERKACVLEERLKKLKKDSPLAANFRRAIADIRRERNLAVERPEGDVPASG